MVDSSVFIQLLRRGQDPAGALLERFETLDLVTCGMIKLEVLRGIRNRRVKEKVEAFMDVMLCVVSDNRLWEEAIDLGWDLDRKGRVLPGADLVIAACARRTGAEVLTLDKHFAGIPGVSLVPVPEDWQ